MIGYLQYAVGETPAGCLRERELYSGNFDCGDIVSFRSPLVDPSEVNRAAIAENDVLNRWFSHFKDQDIVMFNMYDISAQQQGGADFDGDIFFLCNDPAVIHAKIEKPIILDLNDKASAMPKPYTKENIVEYEIMTRDSRIGEITNAATSIENKYTKDVSLQKKYDDYASLLRVFQGKEIDFLKTGFRWHMNSGLKKHIKQLPYFLLYHYPDKMKTYQNLREKNKSIEAKEDQLPYNAYHSPSPMNELCHYICTWERNHILWNQPACHLEEIRSLILNHDLDLSDKAILRTVRRNINAYAATLREQMKLGWAHTNAYSMDAWMSQWKERLASQLNSSEEVIANYVIKASYNSLSVSKALAWTVYGDYILKNLNQNTSAQQTLSITELPCQTKDSYEYLGKYYQMEGGGNHHTLSV